jgi:hypothetical protein
MDDGLTGWDLVHGDCRDAGKSIALTSYDSEPLLT